MEAVLSVAVALLIVCLLVWIVRKRDYVSVHLFGVVKVEVTDKPKAKRRKRRGG